MDFIAGMRTPPTWLSPFVGLNVTIPLARLRIANDLIEIFPIRFVGWLMPKVGMHPTNLDEVKRLDRPGGRGFQFVGDFRYTGSIFWALKRDMSTIEQALTELGVTLS